MTANPADDAGNRNLIESNYDNNQVLRQVDLKHHKGGTYSVTVAPVGNVKENSRGY